MTTPRAEVLPTRRSYVCRLCQVPCSGDHKCINEDNAQMNEVYRITVKYFPAKFLGPFWSSSPAALCLECWRHIIEFYSFQETIFDTQKKLLGRQHEVDIDMKDITVLPRDENLNVLPDDVDCRDIKPPDENCQNVGNQSGYVKNVVNAFIDGELCIKEEEHIDISLSDLEDIDIQFSSDDEMSVSNSLDSRTEIGIKTPQCNSSLDPQTCDGREDNSKDRSVAEKVIGQSIANCKTELKCWICSKTVGTFKLLEDHFRKKHLISQCYITCCQSRLTSRYQFDEHMHSKHTPKEGFMCKECKIEYPSKSILEKHRLQRHAEIVQQYNCPECPEILSTREQLEKHYNAHFVCQECSKVFPNSDVLKSHMQTVHVTAKNESPPASNSLATRKEADLKNTQRNVSQDNQTCVGKDKESSKEEDIDQFIAKYKPKLECWICSKSVATFELLQDHFRLKHASGQCYISCCEIKLSTRHLLENHIRSKHIQKEGLMCGVCKIEYPTASVLKKHQIQRHPEILGHFCCPECPKILPTREQLEKHRKTHFVCQECRKVFKTTDGLKSHTRMAHINKKNKPKPVGSTKTFTCGKCGKAMKSKNVFEKHQRYAHKHDIQHKCNLCEKAFQKFLHLRDHMNYHTKDNYYACPHCPKKFQYWSQLERHMKLEHFEKCTKKHLNQLLLAEKGHALILNNMPSTTNGNSGINVAAEALKPDEDKEVKIEEALQL